jgi:predicted RecB family nuclease
MPAPRESQAGSVRLGRYPAVGGPVATLARPHPMPPTAAAPMPTAIPDGLLSSFLDCKYKALLKARGVVGQQTEFALMEARVLGRYCAAAREGVRSSGRAGSSSGRSAGEAGDDPRPGPPQTDDAAGAAAPVDLDVLQDPPRPGSTGSDAVVPVLYLPRERITQRDKLRLAFHAMSLRQAGLAVAEWGIIVHGGSYRRRRIKLAGLADRLRRPLDEVAAIVDGSSSPPLSLNRHCGVCEFRHDCRQAAERAGDISLLPGLSEPQLRAYRRRGILTVTQLSYTYRRRKRPRGAAGKHDAALQALAIRTSTVYVDRVPTVPSAPTELYVDIEGVPDQDFYYLIGVTCVRSDRVDRHSFWAGTRSEERCAWEQFLSLAGSVGPYVLFHYGGYETRAFRRLSERYPAGPGVAEAAKAVTASACNVLSLIRARLYFPTHSNGLKDIAGCLGYRWTEPGASGIQSLVWRNDWDETHSDGARAKLLAYNLDDCDALAVVVRAVRAMAGGGPVGTGTPALPVQQAAEIRPEQPYRFGPRAFVVPELGRVTRCAYFDYQRERIYARTSPAVRTSLRSKRRRDRRAHRVNAEVVIPVPAQCPRCGGSDLAPSGRAARVVYDIKFSAGGVRRRVLRYRTRRYRCVRCGHCFTPAAYKAVSFTKFGHGMLAWVVYRNIGLLQSHGAIVEEMRELFRYHHYVSVVFWLKKRAAGYYADTYQSIREKIRRGSLVHADEAKIDVKGGSGYVWVFTNLQEVLYVYSDGRERVTPEQELAGFAGVLVCDFYAAYDTIALARQRCLVHFIRDVNEDMLKNPLDEDLRQLAARFTPLITAIVDTIDRHGLKTWHLAKHKTAAGDFLDWMLGQQFASDAATGYQRRIKRYRGELFTFLDHDGVPWNNNNAENAVKRVAQLRSAIRGQSSPDGIRQSLVLLSICETLRRRNLSFLKFLASGETNLDTYCQRG